ncbi:MAG: FHA domain-containing protein [Acidobacteria bacterium]|nr:FHA domain-containing protein [Acidobacteriota bacterium]
MVVECPQCGTGDLVDEVSFGGRSKLEVECTKCGHIHVVRAAVQPEEFAAGRKKPRVLQHTGLTTVVEVQTRLPQGKKVALVAMQGPAKGAIYPITKPEVILGRVEADVVIPDTQVSGKHCTLEIRDTIAILRDLGSTNGIIVGGEQVKTTRLEHLSEFRIGATTFMFTVTEIE